MTGARSEDVAEEDAPARDHRDPIMQRVRVGLTGLAAVFLLTVLAASVLNMLGQDDRPSRLANGAPAGNVANATEDPPKEPLAELGVAPGGNPAKTPVSASPPAASARPTPNSMPAGSLPPH
jgi:hypothetical protein